MTTLKDVLEKNIEKLYGHLQKQNNDESYIKLKESIKKTYTEYTKSKDLMIIFSNIDNFEIYKNDLFNFPVVCIIKNEILRSVYPSKLDIGMLQYFENKDGTEIVFPVIIIDEEVFNSNNKPLFNFIIAHELGHYRKNHVSTIYFKDERRNILKEVEADLYACSILGIEKCIDGLRELAIYIIDNNADNNVVDEVLKRLEFIARKYNISGVLDGFSIKLSDDKK